MVATASVAPSSPAPYKRFQGASPLGGVGGQSPRLPSIRTKATDNAGRRYQPVVV